MNQRLSQLTSVVAHHLADHPTVSSAGVGLILFVLLTAVPIMMPDAYGFKQVHGQLVDHSFGFADTLTITDGELRGLKPTHWWYTLLMNGAFALLGGILSRSVLQVFVVHPQRWDALRRDLLSDTTTSLKLATGAWSDWVMYRHQLDVAVNQGTVALPGQNVRRYVALIAQILTSQT